MKTLLLVFSLVIISACGQRTVNNDHSNHQSPAANSTASAQDPLERDATAHEKGHHAEMTSSPGAASAPVELQFLDSMIAHHKGAVEMALLAETRSAHREVKELAANIILDQEREIGKMAEWRNDWFEGREEAINMEFPGMMHGMGQMDMRKLESLKGHEFDLEFLRQMIPHHEGAVEMAKSVRNIDTRAELKELADDIIAAQESEIRQMKEWQAAWDRP